MLVSIIIPIYNVELYIGDCLLSVLRQTYNNIEVILVDDCSPDNSLDVANQMINELSSRYLCQIIKHDSNKGLSAARNSGVSVAKGDWVYFLDSDDELEYTCIEDLVHLVKLYPSIDFALAGFKVVGSSIDFPINSKVYLDNNNDILSDYFQFKWPVMACNKLINKNFFISESLWFEDGLLHEDELFSFKLAIRARKIAISDNKSYIYKIRESESITSMKKLKNYESLLKINFYRFSKINDRCLPIRNNLYSMQFMIVSTFSFLYSISQNKNLNKDQIENLRNRCLNLFKDSLEYKRLTNVKDIVKAIYLRFLCLLS